MEDCENILEVHMELSYKLEKFEGPLDLLLHLIEKNKVNIYDIPIAEITDQYMEYVRQMDEENLDVVSEFLVMAATLLDIKARMLLPKDVNEEGEEEDPRAELVMRLLEYKKYRLMSEELKDMESGADRVFYKDPTIPPEVKEYAEPVDLDKLLDGVTLTKLQKIFESVMKRQQDKIDPVRSTFGTIKKDPVSLAYKRRMEVFAAALRAALPGVELDGVHSGLHFLLTLPGAGGEKAMVAAAAEQGVRLRGLSEYYLARPELCRADTVVAGYSALREEDVEKVAQALARAWLCAPGNG